MVYISRRGVIAESLMPPMQFDRGIVLDCTTSHVIGQFVFRHGNTSLAIVQVHFFEVNYLPGN